MSTYIMLYREFISDTEPDIVEVYNSLIKDVKNYSEEKIAAIAKRHGVTSNVEKWWKNNIEKYYEFDSEKVMMHQIQEGSNVWFIKTI